MKRYGDNADGWRYVRSYLLTKHGMVVACIIAALLVALVVGQLLAWAGV
jgi:hypothetical protein